MTQREPHTRTYMQGETTVIVHVGRDGQVTMSEEQVSATLALLGCVEV